MSRYIDADLLQEDFKEDHGGKRSLMIDTQPTADVRENISGEWEEYRDWEHGSFKHRCSECGYHDNERDDLGTYHYCPNCGAQMER